MYHHLLIVDCYLFHLYLVEIDHLFVDLFVNDRSVVQLIVEDAVNLLSNLIVYIHLLITRKKKKIFKGY
jgi:hypothetical protein